MYQPPGRTEPKAPDRSGPSPDPVEVRHPVQGDPQDQLAAAGGPGQRLLRSGQRFAGADHAPQDVLEPLARRGDRAIETATGSKLAFGRGEALAGLALQPHGLPAHRHARHDLRALEVGAQAFTGEEQSLVEVAMCVKPAKRRFGEVDGDASPPWRHPAPPPRTLRRQLAFDKFALHANRSFRGNGRACQKGTIVGKCKNQIGYRGTRTVINRIRDIRRQKGMTLAEVAAACDPPTTAQTIGRLETGMRNLSLAWMNRIAAALGVDPELLVKGESDAQPQVVARLTENGPEALPSPRDAILPVDLGGDGPL